MAKDGENVETVSDFIFLGSNINVDSDCSHEIKRCWLLGRRNMSNLESVLKGRDITLLTKVPLAWKIPWTEAPGRLQSMGSLRVGHHWATSLSLFKNLVSLSLPLFLSSFPPCFCPTPCLWLSHFLHSERLDRFRRNKVLKEAWTKKGVQQIIVGDTGRREENNVVKKAKHSLI